MYLQSFLNLKLRHLKGWYLYCLVFKIGTIISNNLKFVFIGTQGCLKASVIIVHSTYSIRLINNKSSGRIIRDVAGQMFPVAHSTAFIYFYYFYLRNKNLWFPRPPSERFSECVIDSGAENSICVELCTLLMVSRSVCRKRFHLMYW